jgi:hypothetical protein
MNRRIAMILSSFAKNLAASCEASNQNNSNCTGCLCNCLEAASLPCWRRYVATTFSSPCRPTVRRTCPCPQHSPPHDCFVPAGAWATTCRAVKPFHRPDHRDGTVRWHQRKPQLPVLPTDPPSPRRPSRSGWQSLNTPPAPPHRRAH